MSPPLTCSGVGGVSASQARSCGADGGGSALQLRGKAEAKEGDALLRYACNCKQIGASLPLVVTSAKHDAKEKGALL